MEFRIITTKVYTIEGLLPFVCKINEQNTDSFKMKL